MKKDDHKKQFLDVFRKLAYGRSSWDVWDDFLSMADISIANSILDLYRDGREEEYIAVAKRYRGEELGLFACLLGIVVEALTENPRQDFMGEIYHALRLEQRQKEQFFTPYHICEFMSQIQFCSMDADAEIEEKGYISVNDPACGAGAMLVAFANVARDHGINYQKNVLFVAQDIDRAAVRMCYLQLALLGCPAIVICGDSLAKPGLHPENDVWYTPFYYLNAWRFQGRSREDAEEGPEVLVPGAGDVPAEGLVQLGYEAGADGQYSICLKKAG